MGSKTKIYIDVEYVTHGELLGNIVSDMHIVPSSLCSFCYALPCPKVQLSLTNFH
jgi:hypothetical protein